MWTNRSAVYRSGYRVDTLSPRELADRTKAPGEIVWTSLCNPTPEDLLHLSYAHDLDPLLLADLLDRTQPIGCDPSSQCTLARLPLYSGDEAAPSGQLAILIGERFIITSVDRTSFPAERIARKIERRPDLLAQGTGYPLYQLLKLVVVAEIRWLEVLRDRVVQQGQTALEAPGASLSSRGDAMAWLAIGRARDRIDGLLSAQPCMEDRAGPFVPVRQLCTALFDSLRDARSSLDRLTHLLGSAECYREAHALSNRSKRSSLIVSGMLVSLALLATVHMTMRYPTMQRFGFVVAFMVFVARGILAFTSATLLVNYVEGLRERLAHGSIQRGGR